MWTENDLREAFEKERDIPYQIPLSQDEKGNSCAGKHARLQAVFEELGLTVRRRICWFNWSSIPLPDEVTRFLNEKESSHLYLEIFVDDKWHVVDATWDPGLRAVFLVNDWGNNMEVGVLANRTLSPEESEAYMKDIEETDATDYFERNFEFHQAFNKWLESLREMND